MLKYAVLFALLVTSVYSQNNFVLTEEHQYAANRYSSIGIASFPVEDQQTEACRQDFCDRLEKIIEKDKRKFICSDLTVPKDKLTQKVSLEMTSGFLDADLPEEKDLETDGFSPRLILFINRFSRDAKDNAGEEQQVFTVSFVLWDNMRPHVIAYGTSNSTIDKGKGGYNIKKTNKALNVLANAVFENFKFIKTK
jgi:hypothetical protein